MIRAGVVAAAMASAATLAVAAEAPTPRWDQRGDRNPLIPGYFADPSIVHDDGRWYIFATIDPWGDDRLGLWTSTNGRDWTFSAPEWPTKAAATSPTSGDAKVWAPSVVKAANGRWYMYVSVGNEVWVGTAPAPAGPWRDANGGKPLIAKAFAPAYHMIDAEAFVDADGQAYLYWGSGWNWTNGHCFAVKLKPDMVTFDGVPRDVTPPGYFEGPFMVRSGAHYLLTFSDGKTTEDSYRVNYAIGDSPLGPFRAGPGSPILSTDAKRDVVSPGHHAVFRSGGQPYILYHRQALPWPRSGDEVLRQIAVDPLTINADGTIARVVPSHGSAVNGFAAQRQAGLRWMPVGEGASAADDNYATLWRGSGERPALVADLGQVRQLRESELRPEFATKGYRFAVDASDDGRQWRPVAAMATAQGSPIQVRHPVRARYLRATFEGPAALWEWVIR
ncbi:family 43 glycosylhydrolase [Sphingomonas sp. KR1UV-12]|uniref:Family 43 glycosylhydrolase n=1 Tax=Sphingomonas aurea TaxID=3063994 RepID=A0ABT9EM25_9SPHN|nr:family 43 glycosylhydrolase [Sphingomonas sp. KR1UV-12]MDP1028023.1 family 43 glycosylhydrolase [Sphingomonas sp. KR1UV-12]